MALAAVFLVAPLVFVVLFSFTSRSIAAFPFTGPSLEWYRAILGDDIFRNALVNSVKLAMLSSLAGTVLGFAAAYALTRTRGYRTLVASGLIGLPLVVPSLLVAVGLSTAFSEVGFRLTLWTATLGHTVLVLPLCFAIILTRLARFDWSVEEASRDLGAGPVHTFLKVVFPAVRPAVVGAIAIAMAFSLDEFVVTFFTIGLDQTLPTVLWSKLRQEVDPGANALATLILGGTFLLITLAIRLGSVRLDHD